MCKICFGIGLVDQIDGHPVRFVRTILCPKYCDLAKKSSAYIMKHDQEWRPVLEDDPMHDLVVEGQKYISLSKVLSSSQQRMPWFRKYQKISV